MFAVIPGSDLERDTAGFDAAARGNPWARLLVFGSITYAVERFAWASPVERVRFPIVMLLAVAGFEFAIFMLKRSERDQGLSTQDAAAFRRRGTLVATGALCAVLLVAALALVQPWYAVLAVLFAYVGFMFSRYVPDALFGPSGEQL
jgi:cobalamin synthase